MGGPNPDTLAGPMSPLAALTMADMAARRWKIRAACPKCRLVVRVSLDALIRCHDQVLSILNKAGGLSEGDQERADELDVEILIADGALRPAKDKLDGYRDLPKRIRKRLTEKLARTVGFAPQKADRDLQQWAKGI